MLSRESHARTTREMRREGKKKETDGGDGAAGGSGVRANKIFSHNS